jgi:hypothetical protein
MISNIPKNLDKNYEKELRQYFSKYEVTIESIEFLFNLKHLKE